MCALRQNRWDCIVVGGGIAGLSAARSAAVHGLSVMLAEASFQFGGQVASIAAVDGIPGSFSGPDLAATLHDAARAAGALLAQRPIDTIAADHAGFALRSKEDVLLARSVVLATGATARRLGVPGEAALEGRGIAHCAACDGPLYRERDVVVVGAGDAALQEALHLAAMVKSVTLVARATPRARRAYLQRAETTPNLRFLWSSRVTEILGEAGVEGVRVLGKDGISHDLACHGVFPLIGAAPATELVAGLAERDPEGRVRVDETLRSSVPGLFAVGAARCGYAGDAIDAASDGNRAASAIARMLRNPANPETQGGKHHAP